MSEWLKCEDRLPEIGQKVLMYAECKTLENPDYYEKIFVGRIDDDDFLRCALGDGWTPYDKTDLIAWMSLPEKPNE